MSGKFAAMIWALSGGVLLVVTFLLLGSNIMFAMMALGLATACALIAGACLLKPSVRSVDRAARERDDEAPAKRRRWGPR